MKNVSRLGFVLIGLLVGIIAAQALPALADGIQGSMMRHGHMHGMGHHHGHHMNGMHGMMHQQGTCPMGNAPHMPEACREMVAGEQAHFDQCEGFMEAGAHTYDDCPMLNGSIWSTD